MNPNANKATLEVTPSDPYNELHSTAYNFILGLIAIAKEFKKNPRGALESKLLSDILRNLEDQNDNLDIDITAEQIAEELKDMSSEKIFNAGKVAVLLRDFFFLRLENVDTVIAYFGSTKNFANVMAADKLSDLNEIFAIFFYEETVHTLA